MSLSFYLEKGNMLLVKTICKKKKKKVNVNRV